MDCVFINNKKNNKEYKKEIFDKYAYKTFIENSLEDFFACKLICSDYVINKESNLKIDTLGIDDNYQLVIFEYKISRFDRLIDKGLMIIDYINEHLSEFKMIMNDFLKEEAKNIIYKPRLVVVGESFHKYDGFSISKLPYNIELVSLNVYNKDYVLIDKKYVSRNLDLIELKYSFTKEIKALFDSLVDYLISLGDEVTLFAMGNVIFVRKIKTFMYIVFEEKMSVFLNNKMININSFNDLEKIEKTIENEYDKR